MMNLLSHGSAQLTWSQLLVKLHAGALSQLAAPGPYARPTALFTTTESYATSHKAGSSSVQAEVSQAAQELGLDAMPLSQLREVVARAIPVEVDGELSTPLDPPRQKKLKYQDIYGYKDAMLQLAQTPQTHDIPKTPALDAGQWVDAHLKEAGISFEPRSGFYNWRGWAKANLPADQYEALLLTESVMADDNTRSALLKQAQHELARLWDWQHRRAALGLSPDVTAAAAAAKQAVNQPQQAVEAGAAGTAEEAPAEAEAPEAAATAAAVQKQAAEDASTNSSSEAAEAAAQIDLSGKGMLELLNAAGVLAPEKSAAEKLEELPEAPEVPEPAWISAIEDVADRSHNADQGASRKLNHERAVISRQVVEHKLQNGERSGTLHKRRELQGVTVRRYKPVAHDDDLFLPSKSFGNWQVDNLLKDSNKSCPVDPDKVTRQAVAIVEAAKRAAQSTASLDSDALRRVLVGGAAGSNEVDGADWLSMPLLDRAVLHKERLKEQQARLDAKPKMQQPWQLLPLDDYTFDLQIRPPTKTLDHLTSYLEVKYADVLLRKDAVQTLQHQLAVHSLTSAADDSSSLSTAASEVLESPPAALTAAKTLSPAEREGIIQALDDLLGQKQYKQYRDAVLQLYCDGLVTWSELQQCWAAAEAGEELEAAENGSVAFAKDRQQLFQILSGRQQLGNLISSTSGSSKASAAHIQAAKQLWEEAGRKNATDWAAAAPAQQASSSSKGAAGSWTEPVSFEEAQHTWQQLLQIAGFPNGPRFEQVLLAGSSSSSSSDVDQAELQEQLQQLQQALEQATGLNVSAVAHQGSSSDSVDVHDFAALQQLCAAPPSLSDLLQQHWDQVAREELGSDQPLQGPVWQQLWQLLGDLNHKYQRQQQKLVAEGTGSDFVETRSHDADVAAGFQRYLRDAEGVPLTPPPYPGASRILRWEQTVVLGPTSGVAESPAELRVKMKVSALELQQETGISTKALEHMLRIAGNRYNPSTGMLTIKCDRFPTREENRRWCLEVLHRLIQEGQGRYPNKSYKLGPVAAASSAAVMS